MEEAMLGENQARIIKKYQNRKLYDTKDSCYVTLDEIAKLIKKGEDVCVIDNKTKADVTSIILTQILVDQEKNAKSILPLTMLKDIIQHGQGSLFDFIQRYVLLGFDTEKGRHEEAERYIDRLVARGELSKVEAKNLLKEVLETPSRDQNDLDQFIGERVTSTLREVSKLDEIEQNITSLTSKLESIETKITDLERR
ncbi:MAG TPA: polyhydroxyalkanoate synthesis regulator DNA-binding domain-containing protein [Bdellovibrionota bacterium]|nr:polyhydroxyalkanoate synthesis regulator DNA-binding domain-containing protein [Bdellovibrionota bacterium]